MRLYPRLFHQQRPACSKSMDSDLIKSPRKIRMLRACISQTLSEMVKDEAGRSESLRAYKDPQRSQRV